MLHIHHSTNYEIQRICLYVVQFAIAAINTYNRPDFGHLSLFCTEIVPGSWLKTFSMFFRNDLFVKMIYV